MALKTNEHPESVDSCELCGLEFVIQHGGQKSGKPPVTLVTVDKTSGKEIIVKLCSSRCLVTYQGSNIDNTLAFNSFQRWGMNYNEIFPEGYLAPARRIHF